MADAASKTHDNSPARASQMPADMASSSQLRLLVDARFRGFFATQLLSALNDNAFKNAVVLWVSTRQASAFGLSPAATIGLCSAVFIAPFFLLSATAGELAD